MTNLHLRNITNHFQDVRLISLASWRQANQIVPRDRNGPYIILQEGYDPEDLTMTADEFILGQSGRWLSLGLFYQLPVPERRAEFIFGTMAQVMRTVKRLPSRVTMFDRKAMEETVRVSPEGDELSEAIQAGKQQAEAPRPHPG
jgi:hypothetical protein